MKARTNLRIWATLGSVAFVYFVIYPDDVKAITAPVAAVLELSQAPSPWLSMVLAVSIVTWAVVRVWGRRKAQRQTANERP
jgi:hypothetical protein